jgi:hypothetical protein
MVTYSWGMEGAMGRDGVPTKGGEVFVLFFAGVGGSNENVPKLIMVIDGCTTLRIFEKT